MFKNILRQIANVLYVNVQHMNQHDLFRGKLGVAIFFYHYSRYSGNQIYHDFANEYINSIYDNIRGDSPKDLPYGLSGVGWSIDYLIRNDFLEIDGDEDILSEVDAAIKEMDLQDFMLEINSDISIFSKGIYFVQRQNIELIRQALVECEELLKMANVSIPLLYSSSILFMINSSLIMGIDTHLCDSLLDDLYKIVARQILLGQKVKDSDLFSLKQNVQEIDNQKMRSQWESILSDAKIGHSMLDYSWMNFIFGVASENACLVSVPEINIYIEEKIYNIKEQNLCLYEGLVGLGLNLIKLSIEE